MTWKTGSQQKIVRHAGFFPPSVASKASKILQVLWPFFGDGEKDVFRLSKVNFVTSKDLSKLESPQKSGGFLALHRETAQSTAAFFGCLFWGYYVYSNTHLKINFFKQKIPKSGWRVFHPPSTIRPSTIRPFDKKLWWFDSSLRGIVDTTLLRIVGLEVGGAAYHGGWAPRTWWYEVNGRPWWSFFVP